MSPMTRSQKMLGRTLAIAVLVGSAVVDLSQPPQPNTVSPQLLQQASIITPEGITVDPNNKEELEEI